MACARCKSSTFQSHRWGRIWHSLWQFTRGFVDGRGSPGITLTPNSMTSLLPCTLPPSLLEVYASFRKCEKSHDCGVTDSTPRRNHGCAQSGSSRHLTVQGEGLNLTPKGQCIISFYPTSCLTGILRFPLSIPRMHAHCW